MIEHTNLNYTQVFRLIRQNKFLVAGNTILKIYGQLNCSSGIRMKKENRVFFTNETEAKLFYFRPCGHCMKAEYRQWKLSKKQVEKARLNAQL